MELFAIESCSRADYDYCYTLHNNKLYPTRKSAEEAMAVLQAKAIVKEREEWESNPCECGDRNCDYRSHYFLEFSIVVMQLADS